MKKLTTPGRLVGGLSVIASAVAALPSAAVAEGYGDYSGAPVQQSDVIGGYSSSPSLLPGGTLALHISAPEGSRYRVDIDRLGFNGGAGERRVACLPGCDADRPAVGQPGVPPPDASGKVALQWQVTDIWQAPPELPTGYYLARFVVTSGPGVGAQSWYPFIVRAPPGRPTKVLVIAPVNTWQAYNAWGGKSLYDFNSTGGQAAWRVSFDRPYARVGAEAIYWFELNLLAFLDQAGYDAGYATDVDVERDPQLLVGHRLIIVAGHSEYWSAQFRGSLETARDYGVNLAFLGANDGYWEVRYEDGERTLYRHVVAAEPDGEPGTGLFRALPDPRPECRLLGVQFAEGMGADAAHSYTVTEDADADRWLAGTGLAAGDVIAGMVGFEWDTVTPGCAVGTPGAPSTPEVLFSYEDPGGHNAEAVRYRAASGAIVFSAGTLAYDRMLAGAGASAAVFRFTENMLNELTAGEAPPVVAAPQVAASLAPPRPLVRHRRHRRHHCRRDVRRHCRRHLGRTAPRYTF